LILGEIGASVQIHHPTVVGAFDWWYEGSYVFLVMELGLESLEQFLLREGPIRHAAADQLVETLLDAVCEIHSAVPPLLHLDIRPANVLRFEDGWKLGDFGLAHSLSGAYTMTGNFNRLLMPPETLSFTPGEVMRIDARWDVWAMGVTIARALLNRDPTVHRQTTGDTQRCLQTDTTLRDFLRSTLTSSKQSLMPTAYGGPQTAGLYEISFQETLEQVPREQESLATAK
jgi:serine/threonine protein kinase